MMKQGNQVEQQIAKDADEAERAKKAAEDRAASAKVKRRSEFRSSVKDHMQVVDKSKQALRRSMDEAAACARREGD